MDRRQFLNNGMLAIISSSLLYSCASNSVQTAPANLGRAYLFVNKGKTSSIRKMDLQSFKFTEVDLPFTYPHTALQADPSGREYIVIDFFGNAVKVDFETKSVTYFKHSDGVFSGHGVIDQSTQTIWTSEFLYNGKQVIRNRSTLDFQQKQGNSKELPGAHHIVWMPNKKTFATGNNNYKSGVCNFHFYDTNTEKLTSIKVPHGLQIEHMMAISDTEVICILRYIKLKSVASNYVEDAEMTNLNMAFRDVMKHPDYPKDEKYEIDFEKTAPLLYVRTDGKFEVFIDSTRDHLFHFGFAVEPLKGGANRFATGHTYSDSVIVWNNRNIEDIIAVKAPIAQFNTPDGKRLLILSAEGMIKTYNLEDKKFEKDIAQELHITGMGRIT